MIVEYITKQPNETYVRGIDFGNGVPLAAGETISSQTVASRDAITGADTSSVLLSGAPIVSGGAVSTRLKKGGTTGERHIVTFHVITSAGNEYEDELSVAIEEI